MRSRSTLSKAVGNGKVGEERKEKEKVSSVGQRKKGIGKRVWLVIDPNGRAQLVEAGKHAIMRRARLPARDLRILDPLLSHPSTILGREFAIVVNLEHIKAIITAQEVLLLNFKDPEVVPIVLDLQRRLPVHFNAHGQQVPGDGGGGCSDLEEEDGHKTITDKPAEDLNRRYESETVLQNSVPGLSDARVSMSIDPTSPSQWGEGEFKGPDSSASQTNGAPSVLPFEFRALEVCLEAACSRLDKETTTLELEAYPALDELTSKLSTLNLERFRQIKSSLADISGRVQKVHDEIEQLLDDDKDMAEMYLTEKLGIQIEGAMSTVSSQENLESLSSTSQGVYQGESMHVPGMQTSQLFDIQESDAEDERLVTLEAEESDSEDSKEMPSGREDLFNRGESFEGARLFENNSTISISESSRLAKLNVEELEMLLEAYFMQIEGTLDKLSTLREYVDDTEDYINIMLDDKQNHLLQMGVLLTAATLILNAYIVVTGVFGMNIEISLFDEDVYRTTEFLSVVIGTFFGCCVLYGSTIAFCKYRGLFY